MESLTPRPELENNQDPTATLGSSEFSQRGRCTPSRLSQILAVMVVRSTYEHAGGIPLRCGSLFDDQSLSVVIET